MREGYWSSPDSFKKNNRSTHSWGQRESVHGRPEGSFHFISLLLFLCLLLAYKTEIKWNDPSALPWTLSLCPQECVDLLFFLKLSGELQYPSLIVLTVCFEGVSFLFELKPRFLQLF